MIRRAGIILNCKNFYILVKSNANQKWSFPKGHIEANEDYQTCAFREFEEETGMDLLQLDVQFVRSKIVGDTMYFVYQSENEGLISRTTMPLNEKEIIDVKWFTQDDLQMLDERSYNVGVKMFLSTISENNGWITI